jgi:hypothetical protein
MDMKHARGAATQTTAPSADSGVDPAEQTLTNTTRMPAPASTPTVASALGGEAARALAERVTDYLGPVQALLLRVRAWYDTDCRQLDELARWCTAEAPHPALAFGEPASQLPVGAPQFHRMVIRRVADQLAGVGADPGADVDNGQALARGVRAVGVFQCLVRDVPAERCACLAAAGTAATTATAATAGTTAIGDLLEAMRRDLGLPDAQVCADQLS